jgi:hypothetical protein
MVHRKVSAIRMDFITTHSSPRIHRETLSLIWLADAFIAAHSFI